MDRIHIQQLKIIADGSIIGIANAKKYNETLKNQTNWTWKQVNEFLLETNKDSLVVFAGAWVDEWFFEFLINETTTKTAFRKFEQSIEVTDESLYLINWMDVTSSLQFRDTKIPYKINENLKIKIQNGFYKVIVKQLFDHNDYDYECENKISYVVELISETKNPDIRAEKIVWTQDFPNDETFLLKDEPNEFDDLLDQLIGKGQMNVEK